jgi:hypothetical protein
MCFRYFALLLLAVSGVEWGCLQTDSVPEVSESKITQAKTYAAAHAMDKQYAVFVDFSKASGKNRLFVVDLNSKKVLIKSLCCHGMGLGSEPEKPVFSNVSGSYCSSLGKYKTGARAYSQWGIHVHYKLHGLEKTNSNAFARIVVLHSYDPVPEKEIYPSSLPLGWSLGCPVISNRTMSSIDSLIKKRNNSLLLWIYR